MTERLNQPYPFYYSSAGRVFRISVPLAVTFAGSWLLFELVKRYSFTRMIFGIKKKKQKQR